MSLIKLTDESAIKPADAKRIAHMLRQADKLARLMEKPGCSELVRNWVPERGAMIAGEFHHSTLCHMLRDFTAWQSDKLRDVLPKHPERGR